MTDDPASLDKLHDIVVPEPVSLWPMAPGWWVLLTLVSAFFLILAIRHFRRWRANAYRRAALQELAKSESAEHVAVILRRTALAIVPRESIAALHDDAWMAWLAGRSPLAVPDSIRAALTRSLYAGEPAADLDELRNFAECWIRQHTRPC
ncbi:DUF4381 domain-containing protein [Haloferula sp. A504]|uniref:DUF4381 domain-containing protein n=1 Tax=Haloferula sp. A504 TaxID=3373601 RepID=UPI0031BF15F6|nr:DUF4381 domain-containing protein [Verrucomicrobiaceae bacterium E54]